MVQISRILVPVDFSERSLGMIPYVREIAQKYNAEVILVHIVNPVFVTPDVGIAPPAVVAVPQWLINERSKQIEEFAQKELTGLPVRRLVFEGIPELQIVDLAKSEGAQLAVISTHGYGVFRRFLLGSVGAKLLDDLDCPVLTGIHMEKHAHDQHPNLATIAVAIDMKTNSSETLAQAAMLARDFGAKLAVIHVVPPQEANIESLRPQLEELVAVELAKLQIAFPQGNLASSVDSGDVAEAICAFAERTGAGLLVIGRKHGDPADDKTSGRLRTNAYSIIRQSPCPVWSI